MKKSLKTVLSVTLGALLLSASLFTAAKAAEIKKMEVVSSNQDIRRINVTGNVRVTIIQGNRFWVAMDAEDTGKVSFKQSGNELRISSTEKKPVHVTVHIGELFRITASNTAVVRSLGKLNLKFLQLIFKDDAIGKLKTYTEGLYTVISDHANLELLGTTAVHTLNTDNIARLDTGKFAALATHMESPNDNQLALSTQPQSKK